MTARWRNGGDEGTASWTRIIEARGLQGKPKARMDNAIYLLSVVRIVAPSRHSRAGGAMDLYFLGDWQPVVRLAHVIFGIGWIGTSFYFVWLDSTSSRQLRRSRV